MEKTFNVKKLKRVGVYTSGGDAPGMNAAIRAVVRTGIYYGLEVFGIYQGYQGMINNDIHPLNLGSMANTIQRGGTVLKSGRCPQFFDPESRKIAAENLKKQKIDALVCIGGDGSYKGALVFANEYNIPVIGVPGTIDNDIYGTEYTIGFDTAVNTALDAIDKIRDTAASHNRLFLVEVMGRNSGFIAVEVGLAGGAEDVFFPDNPINVERTVQHIKNGIKRGKTSSILVVAEGDTPGKAYDIARELKENFGFESKVCILGHVQRGGSPTALDRLIASRFGAYAIKSLLEGKCGYMVGLHGTNYALVDLEKCLEKKKFMYNDILDLVHILSH